MPAPSWFQSPPPPTTPASAGCWQIRTIPSSMLPTSRSTPGSTSSAGTTTPRWRISIWTALPPTCPGCSRRRNGPRIFDTESMSGDRALEAEQAFRRGDWRAAEQLCDALLQDSPGNAPATLIKGMTALKFHRVDEAIGLLNRALELSPGDYVATQWLIGAYYEAARYSEAIELGRRAHLLWPDDADVLIGLSHAYMMGKQDIHASTECLKKAVELRPKDPVLRCKLGAAYESLAKDHEAHCEYLAAIEAEPRSDEAYSRLARLFMSHGNYVEALDTARKGLAALPQS